MQRHPLEKAFEILQLCQIYTATFSTQRILECGCWLSRNYRVWIRSDCVLIMFNFRWPVKILGRASVCKFVAFASLHGYYYTSGGVHTPFNIQPFAICHPQWPHSDHSFVTVPLPPVLQIVFQLLSIGLNTCSLYAKTKQCAGFPPHSKCIQNPRSLCQRLDQF